MDIHETLKDIKSKFRLYMNGPISQSMREKGMDYKINFGIEYPRIKEIASAYTPGPATNWPRLCGKKTSASVKSWQDCSSLSKLSIPK